MPSDQALRRLIAETEQKILKLELEKGFLQKMLKLNDEGRYKAMLMCYDLSLQKQYTEAERR